MQLLLRLPGVAVGLHNVGRAAFDVFMLVPVVHVMSRIPDGVLVGLLRGYDAMVRVLYRGLLRVVVHDKSNRRKLLPRHGILSKRPVISSN